MRPETHYANSSAGVVAYQVFGDENADVNLVFSTNWQNNIDLIWEEPTAVRYLDRLGSFARVLWYDERGSGVSDPVTVENPPTINQWMEDITIVMDAVGWDRAAMLGDTEGGWMAAAYAAFHPDRVLSLTLVNTLARAIRGDDYPIGIPTETADRITEAYLAQHGTTGDGLMVTAPSLADDPRFRRWWVRYQRNSMTPAMLRAGFAWQIRTDLTSVFPSISAPTMVITRRDGQYHRAEAGKWIADHIEGSEYIELAGGDTLPFFAGDFGEVLDNVERFVSGKTKPIETDRRLASVLFTDIVDSTRRAAEFGDQRWLDLLHEANRISEHQVARFGGEFIHTTGDGHLAIFDGPAAAVNTAREVLDETNAIGVDMRAGLHTGEITKTGSDIAGIGVHIASRVIDHAPDNGIAVSSTVKDLTVGSRIEYQPLTDGPIDLKGVPGGWTLYRVV